MCTLELGSAVPPSCLRLDNIWIQTNGKDVKFSDTERGLSAATFYDGPLEGAGEQPSGSPGAILRPPGQAHVRFPLSTKSN